MQPKYFHQDKYDLLTDKMFRTLVTLYENGFDYDWYFKADLDTFVFVNNTKRFLTDKNSSLPVTYGFEFKIKVEKGFHSGGN